MRLSRPCYDKPHRCPGWAGGGMKYAAEDRCEGGRIRVEPRLRECIEAAEGLFNDHPGAHPLRFGSCDRCGVVTWPWALRHLDPTWWPSRLRGWKWRLDEWRRWR